jgi:diguanylate cyclase (GGDEF)-like protein
MVLQQEAQCLSQQVRQSDVVARYGGDEFCVLVSPVDRLGLKSLGQRLCARINELACRQGTNEGQVGASIGVVCHDPASNWTTPEDFLAAADKAMYLAKSRGKNRVIFLDPISRSQVQPEDEAQVSPKPMYVPVEIYARPTECAK